MTYGYSRDDAERNFLITYQEQGILLKNPFQTIDRHGVGTLMQWAISEGRKTRPNPKWVSAVSTAVTPTPSSGAHMIGNNYVSCSPFRVPIARLAAAHAALKHRLPKLQQRNCCEKGSCQESCR
ncbi:MAG: putative PEP-binding protein [Anaerolineales bacterium]